jgi:hypothetical protein
MHLYIKETRRGQHTSKLLALSSRALYAIEREGVRPTKLKWRCALEQLQTICLGPVVDKRLQA